MMETVKLNKLPVPTFSHLGVNYAERRPIEGEARTIAIESGITDISESSRCTVRAERGGRKSVTQYIGAGSDITVDTDIMIGDGACVMLVQVFDSRAAVVSRLNAKIADNAQLELVQLYIGGDTVSDIKAELAGFRAGLKSDIAYTLSGSDKLDINLVAEHSGRKSVSAINVGGVMNGSADKVFKGTIDFKNGASGAKGTESEDVLLIGEDVRSRTVPVILCSEEDVEGSHGATAGRIGDDKIFYMRSRGFSEEEITRLMSRAKLAHVINRSDEETKRRIYGALGWGDEDE